MSRVTQERGIMYTDREKKLYTFTIWIANDVDGPVPQYINHYLRWLYIYLMNKNEAVKNESFEVMVL